jgi:hypothetical protein
VPEQLESEPKKQTPKKSRGPTDEEKPATKRPDMLGNRWAAHPRPDMIGNRLWALRKNHTSGNPRKFQSPEEMRLAVLGYFAWMEGHPLYEAKVVQSAGSPMIISVPRIRAMSQESLCMHIGMSRGAWVGYRTREGFEEIVANTEAAIYAQKFEGAAADLLNSNIITKELGLKERIDHTSGDESVTSITRRIVDCRPPDVRLEEALSDE